MTSPRTPRAISEVARRSPKYPSLEGAIVPTTSTSPACASSTATWIIQLSPGGTSTVTAEPAAAAPA